MFALELRAAVEAAPRDRLAELSSALWKAFSAGAVSEAAAEELSNLIESRRLTQVITKAAEPSRNGHRSPRKPVGSRPRTDASMERRRRWAAAGRMPPKIASHFTLGEQAALAVVAVEMTKRNACTLAIGAVAALAGVSESTVKRALRQARALGLITIQERRLSRYRNDTNVVQVISREWLSWLRLARKRGGVQAWPGTNTKAQEGAASAKRRPCKGLPRSRAAGQGGANHNGHRGRE